MSSIKEEWVHETQFGKWFLRTGVWVKYVLDLAIVRLCKLAGDDVKQNARVLDVGCGFGQSLAIIDRHLKPRQLIAVDVDPQVLPAATLCAAQLERPAVVGRADAKNLPFADKSFDIILCHQLVHHVGDQAALLAELRRVLCVGGLVLVSESCESFIRTFPVRWFFRHPMHAQKTADQYIALFREAGFTVDAQQIEKDTPWWSLLDWGLFKRWGWRKSEYPTTELYLVAKRAS